ncbi:MAG: hypothetical protein O6928_03975, partial [Gammaproteobacteria bacterium]|nr:hypothetical protein [Gammaproteobacteria bacterium]
GFVIVICNYSFHGSAHGSMVKNYFFVYNPIRNHIILFEEKWQGQHKQQDHSDHRLPLRAILV